MDFDYDLPQLGDILLLRGKSLFTKPNMTIQSITRLQRSSYSHVAVVTGQNMIMDANPRIGITLRQWDDVRHTYDVANSLLVRNRTLDQVAINSLIQRAKYYYGQKYKLTALIGNESTFSDNEGMVCSQFIAQIYLDCNLQCSEKLSRKTLPIDIHTFTRSNPDWIRRPLREVKIGTTHYSDETAYPMILAAHKIDNYVAATTKQAFDFSKQFHKLIDQLEGMTNFIDAAKGDLIPITLRMADSPKTDISIEHISASWRHYFLEPRAKSTFLHEDGPAADKQVKLFVKTCEIVKHHNNAADKASNQLLFLMKKIEELARALPFTPTEMDINTWFANHLELRKDAQHQIDILDWIFTSNPSNTEFAPRLDLQTLMEEYDKDPKPDFNEALDTLSIIANYCHLCDRWLKQRPHYEKVMSAHNAAENLTQQ
ncbi:hypothetical protein [Pseudomonas moraviensis]|uniref:hypothetical protein n=1 Tax=Pseudomonas moraviensis TaxID=321662 RepID=UPI00105A08C9|nr:hypothetical protein [Pseudomonas moraviensis]TDK55439.1 hypothetical protein E1508_08190 [Pseudomonas moraviensis]